MIDDIKLKQSFVLERSLYYLSLLPELRKESTDSPNVDSKLAEIDMFLRRCLEVSEYYDYLNTNLELDLRLLNDFSDKRILKELLNRSHSEDDIFLYIDSNIFNKGSSQDIRITIYRKLLSRIVLKFLDPDPKVSNIIISKNYREYLLNRVRLEILRDYESLSITEIPPYRIWDKTNRRMIYVKEIPINKEINKLRDVISEYNKESQFLSGKETKIIKEYYECLWNKYKQVINEKYAEISDHFKYYDGVHIKVALAKTFLKNPEDWVRTESDIALCEGRRSNKSGEVIVDVDNEIHTVLFINDVFDESITDEFIIELHFDTNSLKKEFNERIEGVVSLEIRSELLSLFKSCYDDTVFKIFSEKILKFIGVYINNEIGIKYDIRFNKNKFKIVRFNKKEKISVEKLEGLRNNGEKIIVISASIIPDIIKKKYINDNQIHLIDINDLLSVISEHIIDTKQIFEGIISPFLKNKLKNKRSDISIYRAPKLLSELKKCPEGIKGWKKFEDICIDIISFVFRDSFRNFKMKVQSRNYNNMDIRDAIVQNTGKNFWEEIRHDYNAKNIVFEFKNLSKKIGKKELIQVSDYLEKGSLGRVGIIFSRKGLSKSGVEKQQSLLRDAKKLILVLSENDLMDLINKKMQKEEPEQILEILRFEVETSI